MSYLGSKAGAGVYQAIIALMPPHDTYVELFAGSGAVLQRKAPAAQSFAVDLDKQALDRTEPLPSMGSNFRPGQMRMSMAPAAKSRSTIGAGNYSHDRLGSSVLPFSPLPDSGATKPGHARSAECVHAEVAC